MAAIGSEPTIPLNVSPIMAAAAPREPIVTPNAVAAMADAFRSGQITTADIIQRFGEHAKAKQKAELSTLQEVTSPEAQQSRRLAREAGDVKAKADIALAPLAQQKTEAELKAAIYDARIKGSGLEVMHNALLKAGWPVEINPQTGPTEADRREISRRFAVLEKFVAAKTKAADIVKADANYPQQSITVDTPSGPQVIEGRSKIPFVVYKGQQISPEKFKKAVQFDAQIQQLTPAAYDALGQPDAPDVFEDIAPGTVDSRPVAGPAPAPAPQAAAASQPTVGQPFDTMAQVTSVKPAPGATKKTQAETAQELAASNALGTDIAQVKSIISGTRNVVGPLVGSAVGQTVGTFGAIVGIGAGQELRNAQRTVEIFKSKKVLEGAQQMKGNLSDKDIRFLTDSIPKLSDDESVWINYLNKAEQMNEATKLILRGELPKDYSVLDSGPAPTSTVPTETIKTPGGVLEIYGNGKTKFIPNASTNAPAGVAPKAATTSPLVEPKGLSLAPGGAGSQLGLDVSKVPRWTALIPGGAGVRAGASLVEKK